MSQVHPGLALEWVTTAATGQRVPMTAWEQYQLLWFYLSRQGMDELVPKFDEVSARGAEVNS